ncbi:uncharacterized protein LOC118488860 [Helianthus annuus]|uniref:uncharacterized protein LOC118488860 n=1 Tax=Helianthus annuus TaxID=4232 RepID=UPI00165339B4|nr:uncharacterized protein LOC118488860 [Helianthus annuus]
MAQLLNNSNNANQIYGKRYQQHEERFMAQEGEMRSQKASIQTIENQVGQLAKMLSERPQGSLPGNTEQNPRGHVNAVMTRSGKTTGPDKSDSPPITETVQTETSDEVHARRVPASTAQPQEPVADYTPPVPYPSRLKKQKNDEQDSKFLEMYKQLHINIPFFEELAQMPKYARFLKDILTNKQKLESLSCVLMNENYSALLQNRLPEKMGDPGSFTLRFEEKSKPSVEDPPSLELKELPPHLEYAFLDEECHLPVIISVSLAKEEKRQLLEVLKLHKKAMAWKIMDIKGINPSFYTHKILMEDDYKPSAQHQRPLNPNLQDVVKKEVIKLLDAGLIYPISDSVLHCMVAIFHDMIEDSIEVFMEDFSVFGSPFNQCLGNLKRMLMRCEETNLVLNWEKCHFMVKEGVILGHKISEAGLEVDPEKVDIISKLPPPTSVNAIRSFLGHAGFYRRFIKDFSKITRPMTRLLEKEAPFVFLDECIKTFKQLKQRIIEAPILVAPDWVLPFEIMYDASDYAIGAVLRQRREKHFRPIYYANKTLHDAQENYTTTKKELLAVVYAFDKFRSYLVLSKTILYTVTP